MGRGGTLLVAALVVSCGGKPAPAPVEPAPTRHVIEDTSDDDAGSGGEEDGVEIVGDKGHVDADLAARMVEPHAGELNACYADRLNRRRWLGGSVELTWRVAGDGALTGVHVATSDLGAWPVEKCLLAVARGISFGKPIGGKPAEVTFPVQFSAGSGALPWDEDTAIRAVGGKFTELRACAKPGGGDPENVTITIYVGTRGKVQSVGFAAPAGVTDAWADCAEAKVSAWTLTDPRGKVAKLSFVYRPAALSDDEDE